MSEPIEPTVFVVDDDRGVRNSIRELLISVGLAVETFESAQSFLETFDPARRGCLILDIRMAHMSGLALEAKLAEIGADLPIVFISGHGDISMAVNAIKRGAVDFVPKPYHEQQLLDAVNEALRRDESRCRAALDGDRLTERAHKLTARERQVLDLALRGHSSKVIARELGISHRTVELHRSNLLEKLGIASITELLRLKRGNGI
ncbi:MAG: response regulator transcription factor [Gammaproteobacteria bacterium]|nr:response regulator transcription factor [Gammaproteobacteria bacterium]MCP5458324.1 response regulator transcription factor [Gammaproteobacteria bacterium]